MNIYGPIYESYVSKIEVLIKKLKRTYLCEQKYIHSQ